MDIIGKGAHPVGLLDPLARRALGPATCGVSVSGGLSRIHLLNDNPPEQARASDLLHYFGKLEASASVSQLRVGDADAVVSCRDAAIAGDDALAYIVLLDDEVTLTGEELVADGAFTLRLSASAAGLLTVFLYRTRGNYACAILHISVSAAGS